MASEKYDAVVISGGGSKGLLTLGALHYEYEKGRYDPAHVRIYAGTSIGSVISLLLICGYTPMEVFNAIYNMSHFFDVGDCHDMWDVVKFMGLMSIRAFTDRIGELVVEKLGSIPTLRELRKLTGKTLVVSAANVSKMRCEYYTHRTHPDLGCVNAVKLSSNLPLVFQRIRYDDCYVTDGGMMDNFPLQYIDDGKMKILGIVTTGSDFSLSDEKFVGYFYRLVVMPINANTKLRCDLAKSNTRLIKLKWNNTLLVQFSMPNSQKMKMFIHGYDTAEYIDKRVLITVDGWWSSIDYLDESHDDWNDWIEDWSQADS